MATIYTYAIEYPPDCEPPRICLGDQLAGGVVLSACVGDAVDELQEAEFTIERIKTENGIG